MNRKVLLVVLDGWGYRDCIKDNAIKASNTPCFDELWNNNPHSLLDASGEAVGLPKGQMGNSEVGHTTIGAGAILDTDLVRISKAADGGFFKSIQAFDGAFLHAKKNNSTLHLMSLLGDGGVHSHDDHLFTMLQAAKESGVQKIAVHSFTDGRDTPPQSAAKYIKTIEDKLAFLGIGKVATLSGRYYAMDRDNNWDRLTCVEKMLFEGEALHCSKNPSTYLQEEYENGKTDEQLDPVIFNDYKISKHDSVIFLNYRPDRARMLATKISEFASKNDVYFSTMTNYDSSIQAYVAFGEKDIETTLAKEISFADKTQIHIAETEKYAHATYFLNGGVKGVYPKEEHALIESRKDVRTHDEAPEMKAKEIADKAIDSMDRGVDFIFLNFANPDMIGHTGNVPAIISAIETVDYELGRLVVAAERNEYVLVVTADHGNAELNKYEDTGIVHTSHTTNFVPLIISGCKETEIRDGGLSDVAPTVLYIMGISKPEAMTGNLLIN